MSKPVFALGQVVATPGACEVFNKEPVFCSLLDRHINGDWGDLDAEDKAENDRAIKDGNRILSAYLLPRTGVKIWIITEADRSVTTLLLPEEY